MNRTTVAMMFFLIVSAGVVCFAETRFIEVRAKKFAYEPHRIEVNRGDEVTIRLISEDVTHGLYLDGYQMMTQAHPGQDGSITFVASRSGRFVFRCSVTCGEFHPFMVGHLLVRPNNRFWLFVLLVVAAGLASLGAVLVKKKR